MELIKKLAFMMKILEYPAQAGSAVTARKTLIGLTNASAQKRNRLNLILLHPQVYLAEYIAYVSGIMSLPAKN